MSAIRDWGEEDEQLPAEVLDLAHLEHYTAHDRRLAAEVLGLFLAQLPSTLKLLECSETAADWKFAAHALKGSAASVGAARLRQMAVTLEELAFPGDAEVRKLRLQSLRGAIAEVRSAAQRAYPAALEG